jgi:hypothetical protein
LLRGSRLTRSPTNAPPTSAKSIKLSRIGSVGVCGSDIHYYEHGRIGPYVVERALILGHEAGGVITAVGEGVTDRELALAVQVARRHYLEEQSKVEIAATQLRGNPGHLLVGVDDEQRVLAAESVGEPGPGGRGLRLIERATVEESAMLVIVGQHGLISLAEPK